MASQQKTQQLQPFPKCLLTPDTGVGPHDASHALLSAAYMTETDDLASPRLDNVDGATADAEVARELDIKRLNEVQAWWWIVGRPMPPRPLHKQLSLGRNLVIDEKMDMHLVWTTGRIFLKPIPKFLLCSTFWSDYLTCPPTSACPCNAPAVATTAAATTTATNTNTAATATTTTTTIAAATANANATTNATTPVPQPQTNKAGTFPLQQFQPALCDRQSNRKLAFGFLLSYVALIRHESDFIIAQEKHLVPKTLTWSAWHAFASNLLSIQPIYNHIDPRFVYGELRLSRLNKIYRLLRNSYFRGYVLGWQRYDDFWRQNFTVLTSSIAYMVIVLTAMQVGLATDTLGGSLAFQRASYGFTVFSILGPLVFAGLLFVQFCIMFVDNWVSTKSYQHRRIAAIQARV